MGIRATLAPMSPIGLIEITSAAHRKRQCRPQRLMSLAARCSARWRPLLRAEHSAPALWCWRLGPRAGEVAGPTLDDLDWWRGPFGIDLGSTWTLDKVGPVPVQSVPVQNSWDVAIRTQSRSPRWPRRQACRA